MINTSGYNNFLTAATNHQFQVVEDFYNANRAAAAAAVFPRTNVVLQQQQPQLQQPQQPQQVLVAANQFPIVASQNLLPNDVQLLAKYNELFAYWKDYRLSHLKNDLEVFVKQVEAHKIQQFDLNNKIKSLQTTLFSSINDKTGSCQNILMNFQTFLNSLSSRIAVTENLVTNLVTFFSNVGDINDANRASNDIENVSISGNSSQNDAVNFQYVAPYDLASIELPDESTVEIARKVREYLQISKISQKKFAETLLNMKQANFSSLLSQPLTWQQLSKTYKDRFLIMHTWLNDPYRMDKLDTSTRVIVKGKGKNKRYSILSASQQLVQQAKMHLDENNRKRTRICLTNDQTSKLKISFIKNPYPSSQELDQISIEADLEVKKVAAWFAHQRQVYKIQNKRRKE